MKKATVLTSRLIVVFLISLSSYRAFSQFYTWMPQQALTDSSADNTNPCLVHYLDGTWNNDDILLFWERSEDSLSTTIFYRGLDNHPLSEPQLLLSAPGVHFTHPRTMLLSNMPVQDTAFILFYESDANGNKDIYFMNYSLDGNFSEPRLLSALPGNDEHLTVCPGWQSYVAWENSGKVFFAAYDYTSHSFFPVQELVSADASEPNGDEMSLAYIEQTIDSSNVILFERDQTGSNFFTEPLLFYGSGENAGLEICKGFDGWGSTGIRYVWQNRLPGQPWGLVHAEQTYFGSIIDEFRSPQYNYHSPDQFDFPIIIKGPTYLTFVTDSLGNEEVMTSQYLGYDIQNQSVHPGPDRNPHFFSSVEYAVYQIQLLWESLRDGHWTIFRSHYDMIFGSGEASISSPCKVFPNPFIHEVTFSLPSGSIPLSLVIYNSLSSPVRHLTFSPIQISDPEIQWDGCNDRGRELPGGLYYLCIHTSTGTHFAKVMKR